MSANRQARDMGPVSDPVSDPVSNPVSDPVSNPWDQLPGEPDRWYGRFQLYLDLGPARSVTQAYCRFRHIASAAGAGDWSVKARKWHWRERAHAWDAYQRSLLALSERNLRIGLRHNRIGITEETIDVMRIAIDRAEVSEADREQARKWLPHLCDSLRGMLVVQRQEFEHDFTGDDPAEDCAITADDLRAAQREMEAQDARHAQESPLRTGTLHLSPLAARPGRRPGYYNWRAEFLICTGADSELILSLETLKSMRAATGLEFQRSLNPTGRSLHKALARQRSLGKPIACVHMAQHATTDGVELADGVVDWNWLSTRLEGVRVLLLANCAGSSVAPCVSGVPCVIALDERIPPQDASALVQRFWHGIGAGLEPPDALGAALAERPASVREMVRGHW